MKKILYILQQSVYDKEGYWSIADSNIQIMQGIIEELVEKTDWEFYIMIAKLEDFKDLNYYSEIIDHPQVKFLPYDFPVSAFLNRQHFDTKKFTDTIWNLLPTKIDIVWNNITELTRNIKTVFNINKKTFGYPKFITCCYWLDLPYLNQAKVDLDISYQFRQFDGFEASDLAVFTCKSCYKAFLMNARISFQPFLIKKIKEKSVIWDFGYSSKDLNKYKVKEKFYKPTILFLNRLSGINYTHHKEFIQACEMLCHRNKEKDFQIIFTNPSKKYNLKELKENYIPKLFVYKNDKHLTRQEYVELLWKSDISVHLFDTELYGGCANTESIHCDNIAIMPKLNEYYRRGGYNYKYYCEITPESICDRLEDALNDIYNKKVVAFEMESIKKRNKKSSFEIVSKKVLKNIISVL